MSNVYAAIEIWDLCCDNMICKNDRLMYNFSWWDLAHSSMFMFYQVRVCTPTLCVFQVMYVRTILSHHGIARKVPKVDKTFPIMIGGHLQYRILWDVYFSRRPWCCRNFQV